MGDLVDHRGAGPSEPNLTLHFGRHLGAWVLKAHFVSVEREHTCTGHKVSQTVYEVPVIAWIEVLVRHSKDAEGVPRLVFDKCSVNFTGMILNSIRRVIVPRRNLVCAEEVLRHLLGFRLSIS